MRVLHACLKAMESSSRLTEKSYLRKREELKEHSIVFFLLGETWKRSIRSAQAQGVTDLCHSQILKRDYVTGWKSNIFREKTWFEVSVGSMRSADPSLISYILLYFPRSLGENLLEKEYLLEVYSKSLFSTLQYHFEMFPLVNRQYIFES